MADFLNGGVGNRLVYQDRLKSVLDLSRRDYRQKGVLYAVEGLVERFHDNNFKLLGLSRGM